jgi:precorrin-6B methylase 2
VFLSTALVGVRAADGKLLWRYDRHANSSANSYTPLAAGNLLLSPNGRTSGVAVLGLKWQKQDEVLANEVRFIDAKLDGFQDSTVRLGNLLFGTLENGIPCCLDWKSGMMTWKVRTDGKGKAALTYADNRLYLLHADGTCLLAEASSEAFRPRGKFTLPDHVASSGATFPVITCGRMYVRDNDHLFCYDIRATKDGNPAPPRLTKLDLAKSGPPPATTDRSQAKNKQPDAIFVPTPHDVVAKMLELAEVKKTDVVYDLGSGDGRIVIAAAKAYGAKAVGVELDKQLVEQSQSNAEKAGVSALVRIEYADIFKRDLSDADVIALYLPPNLMDRLLPQLEKVKPGTRIVSHFFKFNDIPPEKSLRFESRDDGDFHEVYLWTAPLRRQVK